jgi:hypothetical protein
MEPTAVTEKTGRRSGKIYAAGTIINALYVEAGIGLKYTISANIREMGKMTKPR